MTTWKFLAVLWCVDGATIKMVDLTGLVATRATRSLCSATKLVSAGYSIEMGPTQSVLRRSGGGCTLLQRCGKHDFLSIREPSLPLSPPSFPPPLLPPPPTPTHHHHHLLGRGQLRIRSRRLGGRAVGGTASSRLYHVCQHDEVDKHCAQYFVNSSLSPVLLFRRRLKSVADVLKEFGIKGLLSLGGTLC